MTEETVEAPGRAVADALVAMGEEASTWVRKALGLYVVGASAVGVSRRAWTTLSRAWSFVVTIDDADELYPDVQRWVLERVPPHRQRSLTACTGRHRTDADLDVVAEAPGSRVVWDVRLSYNGRRDQVVPVGGHRVRVSIETESGFPAGAERPTRWERSRVVFTAQNVESRDAVLEVLRALATQHTAKRQPQVFISNAYGNWRAAPEIPPRRLSSVVLRAGQAEDLSRDLGTFLASEAAYNGMGYPWHRGYLLTGPAGTGKTSVARALAGEYSLDVYYLPLSAVPNDAVLMAVVAELPPRSMLLLEDIDIAHSARDRDDSDPGVTLSGLLNVLDGVMTPHGLVIAMTTNNDAVLDHALVRPGRVDRTASLGYLDDDQAARLVAVGLGLAPEGVRRALPTVGARRVTPADLSEVLRSNLGDPETALVEAAALLGGVSLSTGRGESSPPRPPSLLQSSTPGS